MTEQEFEKLPWEELWAHITGYLPRCVECGKDIPFVPRDEAGGPRKCPHGCGYTVTLGETVWDNAEYDELDRKQKRRWAYERGDRLTP